MFLEEVAMCEDGWGEGEEGKGGEEEGVSWFLCLFYSIELSCVEEGLGNKDR